MNLKLKRTPGIYIVGFMGSGKTTVGRLLAEEIGWRFADLDEDIEHSQRRSVSDIFLHQGEEAFRRIEHEALSDRVRSIRRGDSDRAGRWWRRIHHSGEHRTAARERNHTLD